VSFNLDLVGALLKEGLLGILLFLALFALWAMFLRYEKAMELRSQELRTYDKIIVDLTQAVRELTTSLRESRRRR